MALKLTWVNHASFILSDGIATLISDPWLEGTAFNDSWKLLSPTALSYDDFKNITHIWYSHEHPDHFAPLVIKKIPAQYRKNITVLYQKTIDHKVAEFCKKIGFKAVIEIEPNDKIKLSPTMTVSCQKVRNDSDSWMLIETPEMRILNLNDCHFQRNRSRIEKLKQIVGNVDIVLTQFSYARWVGNRNQTDKHRIIAGEQLEEMKLQLEILQPKMVIPFASYVWFCHEENCYMNKSANHISDVFNIIPTWGNFTPLVFYPGDVWNTAEKWDKSQIAIDRYENDFKNSTNSLDLVKSKPVDLEELRLAAKEYREKYMKDNNVKKMMTFQPFKFYLTDYSRSFRFSYLNGMEDDNSEQEYTDISLASQAMLYCFKTDWGLSTLYVSGRFDKPINGNYSHFEIYQWVADLKNNGRKVPNFLERIGIRLKQAMLKN